MFAERIGPKIRRILGMTPRRPNEVTIIRPTPTKSLVFNVSVPRELSRQEYLFNKQAGANPPSFQLALFNTDIKRMFLETSNMDELAWNTLQINNHYIWLCASIGILHRASASMPFKAAEIPADDVLHLGLKELGIGQKNSVIEQIIADGRPAYIPDTAFKKELDIRWLPSKVHELIAEKQQVLLMSSGSVLEKGWDVTALQKYVAPYARSMFVMPIREEGQVTGLLAIGYPMVMMFSSDNNPGALDIKHTQWMAMLGDSVGLTLNKLA